MLGGDSILLPSTREAGRRSLFRSCCVPVVLALLCLRWRRRGDGRRKATAAPPLELSLSPRAAPPPRSLKAPDQEWPALAHQLDLPSSPTYITCALLEHQSLAPSARKRPPLAFVRSSPAIRTPANRPCQPIRTSPTFSTLAPPTSPTPACVSPLRPSSHANPSQFARPAPSATPTVPQEEIDRVKKEYDDKLARKADKAKAAADDKKKDSTWLSTGFSAVSTLATSTTSLFAQPPSPPPVPAGPPPKVFVLNRGIFAMRVEAQKKRWQAKEAKERVGNLGLPSAPRGGLVRKVV